MAAKNVKTAEGRRIARMYWEQGMSIKDIIKKTGRSNVTVHKFVKMFAGPNSNSVDVLKSKVSISEIEAEDSFQKTLLNGSQLSPIEAIIEAATTVEALCNELEEIEVKLAKATIRYNEATARFQTRASQK